MRLTSARLASARARCVLLPMAEWSALNQIRASAESLARSMHECTPSGECSSRQRFSAMMQVCAQVRKRTMCGEWDELAGHLPGSMYLRLRARCVSCSGM